MSKAFKWILYILLGLVILVLVVGVVYASYGAIRSTGYPMMRPGIRMMEPNFRFVEPFYFHTPVRSIFGALLCLGVILLVIVGIVALVYALTQRNRPIQNTPTTQATVPPAEIVSPTAEEVVAIRTCANCGKPAQQEWNTCPYCGNPLT